MMNDEMVCDKIKSERKCCDCNDGDSGEVELRCENAKWSIYTYT